VAPDLSVPYNSRQTEYGMLAVLSNDPGSLCAVIIVNILKIKKPLHVYVEIQDGRRSWPRLRDKTPKDRDLSADRSAGFTGSFT